CSSTEATARKIRWAEFAWECDVTDPHMVKEVLSDIRKKLGRLDALVNNAGLAGSNPLGAADSDDLWHQILEVNLNGTYYVTKAALPILRDRSRIVNIASVLALKGVPDQTAYCAAKHGVLGFTRALAHQLAARRIPVNAVCPGWVRTEMARGRIKELGITEKSLDSAAPMRRIVEPAEVADFVFGLVTSKAGAMISGQALTIDGGALA
ncbi:MAG: SDR family NAD(P)-dependent oxidoreductase, partial [Bdellovibrionota bacterium]